MYELLGEALETICRQGSNEAIFIAPFIKRAVFGRLLAALPERATVLCVTRWRPEEVAAGVSDPDIWLDIQSRPGAMLRICPSLHAKYYRIDSTRLIGSANLTGAALGWSGLPNIEVLYSAEDSGMEWQAFERHVLTQSVACNNSIYQQSVDMAALLKVEMPLQALLTEGGPFQSVAELVREERANYGNDTPMDLSRWLPQTRQPADLYMAYSGQIDRLTTASRTTALSDLIPLQVPPGFSQLLFVRYVAMQLLQMPCISRVDDFVTEPQRFGSVKTYIQRLPCSQLPAFDASRAWQTLMRWLLYFLPERYVHSVPSHSEIFQRRR